MSGCQCPACGHTMQLVSRGYGVWYCVHCRDNRVTTTTADVRPCGCAADPAVFGHRHLVVT